MRGVRRLWQVCVVCEMCVAWEYVLYNIGNVCCEGNICIESGLNGV